MLVPLLERALDASCQFGCFIGDPVRVDRQHLAFFHQNDAINDHRRHILFVTERAVFRLTNAGLELIEVAPGIDLQTQVLDVMEFRPAIGEIKRAGYDVFLVLEATIGFNKRSEELDDGSELAMETEASAEYTFRPTDKIRWTSQDEKFLRALKISVEEEAD